MRMIQTMINRVDTILPPDDVLAYHERGFLGPYQIMPPEAMRPIARHILDGVFTRPGPNPADPTHSRHLDTPEVYALASHPAIVKRLTGLLGEDIQCWTGGSFHKEAYTGKATAWHQDINYWPLSPAVTITCWIALTDIGPDNSPLHLIPGTHHRMLPHIPAAGLTLAEQADPRSIDVTQAVPMTMPVGGFVLFSERLVHGAPANRSPLPRSGLVLRYTMGSTKVFHGKANIAFPEHRVLFVSGEDRFGINRVGQPPVAHAHV